MPAFTDTTTILERQLLLQLGDRIKRLRKAQGINTVEMARRVGISRTTLSAVEAGDPAPSIGTYLRVMSVLGVAGDLALLVSDTFQPPPEDSAAGQSKRARLQVQALVTTDSEQHQAQDLQTMALHKEAIRLTQEDPALLQRALDTLRQWRAKGGTRSMSLWEEWETISLRDARGARFLAGRGELRSFVRHRPCRQSCPKASGVTCWPRCTR